MIPGMAATVPFLIRWPHPVLLRIRQLAEKRHTTAAELIRQATIERYGLEGDESQAPVDVPLGPAHHGGLES